MTIFVVGAATDVGQVRRTNQDHYLVADPVFVVADGMGGHSGGEIASEIAVNTMARADHVASIDDLIGWMQKANEDIVSRARTDLALKGMGTTCCALVGLSNAGPHRIGIANVGDSRLYRLTADGLHQHSEDHSLVESLVRDGRLSRAEAANHPQRNIVTRALGIDEKVLVDAWELVPVAGDRYVICSDGLFGEIGHPEIHEVLTTLESPQAAAEDLVERACAAGGRDNVTVVIVDIAEADSVDDPPEDRVTDIRKALPDGVLQIERPSPADDPVVATDPHPDEIRLGTPVAFFTWRLAVFVAAVLIVLAVLFTSITVYARSAYFVGVEGENVVIYKGRPDGVLWFDPTVEEMVDITVSDLDPDDLESLSDAQEFDTLEEARQFTVELTERAEPAVP